MKRCETGKHHETGTYRYVNQVPWANWCELTTYAKSTKAFSLNWTQCPILTNVIQQKLDKMSNARF